MPPGRFFDDLVLSKVILGAGWAVVCVNIVAPRTGGALPYRTGI
jgi:hypothetical protein